MYLCKYICKYTGQVTRVIYGLQAFYNFHGQLEMQHSVNLMFTGPCIILIVQ